MKKLFVIFTSLLIFSVCFTFTGCEQAEESTSQETVTQEEQK
jgi:uncharacterized lipoprotein YehR (DUF1307 family)